MTTEQKRTIGEHKAARMDDLRAHAGQMSDDDLRDWAVSENLIKHRLDPTDDELQDIVQDSHANYGLSLEFFGCNLSDSDNNTWLEPGEDSPQAIIRLPDEWQDRVLEGTYNAGLYLLSTGGPEDGFLFVYGAAGRGGIETAWYYEADWNTFERVQLNSTEVQTLGALFDEFLPQ